jgi:hypothetical protein
VLRTFIDETKEALRVNEKRFSQEGARGREDFQAIRPDLTGKAGEIESMLNALIEGVDRGALKRLGAGGVWRGSRRCRLSYRNTTSQAMIT